MGFAEDLLDGFDVLYRRTEGVLKVTTDMSVFYKKLSLIEAEYAKGIIKLAEGFSAKKLSSPHLDGTVKDGWAAMLASLSDIGKKHSLVADAIMKDFSIPVQDYVNKKEGSRKKLTADGTKLTKDMKTQMETLARIKGNFVKLSKEADAAQLVFQKSQQESKDPKKVGQLHVKATQASEKAALADNEYRDSLKQTNQKQADFYDTDMPNLLREFQQFEEDRVDFMKTTLLKFGNVMSEIPPIGAQAAKSMEQSAISIDKSQDIALFVQENRTGVTPPPAIEYEPHVGVPVASNVISPPSTPRSGTVLNPADMKIGTYKAPSSSPTAERKWGLSDADKGLPDDKKREKLERQIQEIDGIIRIDTVTKTGLEKLAQGYAKDPVAHKKAEAELLDAERKLDMHQQGKILIQSQLNALTGGPSSPPSSVPAAVVKARGLFSYDATCDQEMSFKEGDTLTITEQDDSGWWYAELNGQCGFIPQNYVEIIQ